MKALMKLYRRVPALACQGHCAESCGPIIVAAAEQQAMEQVSKQRFTLDPHTWTCGYLHDGRCTVYAVRPLICRLWGVAAEMPCPWGCRPQRVISRREGHVLLDGLARIGGPWVEPPARAAAPEETP